MHEEMLRVLVSLTERCYIRRYDAILTFFMLFEEGILRKLVCVILVKRRFDRSPVTACGKKDKSSACIQSL